MTEHAAPNAPSGAVATTELVVAIATRGPDRPAAALAAVAAGAERLGRRATVVHVQFGARDAATVSVDGALPVRTLALPGDGGAGSAVPAATATRADALRAVLETARELSARAVVVLDPDRLDAGNGWLSSLAEPVLANSADFVLPVYARHRFAGALANGIVYPMTRALFGKRVRQPLISEFSCTPAAVDLLLGRSWPAELARFGSDCWLLAVMLCSPLRTGQAYVPGTPGSGGVGAETSLSQVLARVLGAFFTEVERQASFWQRARGSRDVPAFGQPAPEPEGPVMDTRPGLEAFRLAQKNLTDLWGLIMPPQTLLELRRVAQRPDPDVRIGDELWARIVYDFTLAHRTRVMNRDHLAAAFTPIYLGWFAGFVASLDGADHAVVEERVEQMCQRFEDQKPYVIARWRSPDRFNP